MGYTCVLILEIMCDVACLNYVVYEISSLHMFTGEDFQGSGIF